MQAQREKMLHDDIFQHSYSSWSSPLVKKKKAETRHISTRKKHKLLLLSSVLLCKQNEEVIKKEKICEILKKLQGQCINKQIASAERNITSEGIARAIFLPRCLLLSARVLTTQQKR